MFYPKAQTVVQKYCEKLVSILWIQLRIIDRYSRGQKELFLVSVLRNGLDELNYIFFREFHEIGSCQNR